ncbi:MAG: C4-dicarboxylate ABC transporter [Pelagibacteraceae bacterium]|jgi:TRAP-type mannitol/chloroaromatic compound transport system substrate-binding protein|nr:MAG: C4-dicarboxylate ABC transporter [Pelagibacteraceae bacterium]|tara:strand:- start:2340 stop:3467 length:1128 start_codon:yes stop_codon:yes gene_type:complete
MAKKKTNNKTMKRRNFLKGAGAAALGAAAVSSFPAPAISGGHMEWIACSAFGKAGGLGKAIDRFASYINNASDKLKITVYHGGELVPPLESLDAVRSGAAQMAYGAGYYWTNISMAPSFSAALPFGLTAQEQNAWCYYGGGIEAADKAYNAIGVKFLPMGNTGNQMGGWFNKEINSLADFEGLKIRMPGLGGEVLKSFGANTVLLAGADVLPSLASGAIDATEWIGPAADLGKGLHQAAKYYYNPGWHEPATILDCSIDMFEWEKLDDATKELVTIASKAVNMEVLSMFQAANDSSYQKLINEHGVQMRQLPDPVMNALGQRAGEVCSSIAAEDPVSQALFSHIVEFRSSILRWTNTSEKEYMRVRSLPFTYPSA